MDNILYTLLSVIVLLNTPIFIFCSLACFVSGWIVAVMPGQKPGAVLRSISSGLCLMLFVTWVVRRQLILALVSILIYYWMYPAGFAAAKIFSGKKREISTYQMVTLVLLVLFICYEVYALVWNLVG